MFRHKTKEKTHKKDSEDQVNKKTVVESNEKKKSESVDKKESSEKLTSPSSQESVDELLEKNLKWSQIIYEQNRRINRKLTWISLAGWLRLILILAPLIIALFYLPPVVKEAWKKFDLIKGVLNGQSIENTSIDDIIKVINLTPAQKEQAQVLLNK